MFKSISLVPQIKKVFRVCLDRVF